jgi:asparagine synthase (glutamine-hydrolysing)
MLFWAELMCGQFGILNLDEISLPPIESLLESIKFRGPDGNDFLDLSSDHGPVLGHTRLSIIGGRSAAQPMWSDDGRFCLTFNGEIYNFEDLASFFKIDHRGSDTRLLVELWGQLGSRSIALLRGQFSFCIWDKEKKETFLVTDAFGILPMYLYNDARLISWSSSARLFSALGLSLKRDTQATEQFLKLRFRFAPNTFFTNVEKLPPASLVSISQEGNVHRETWGSWGSESSFSTRVLSKDLLNNLQTVISRSLRSDQEVGIFLSGGVDSALIAAISASQINRPTKAFTAHWGAKSAKSELREAQDTCKVLNIDLIDVEVSPKDWWAAQLESSKYREAPNSEIADPVIYLLSQIASEHVKVVLSGEGADELFLGYQKYRVERALEKPWLGFAIGLALQLTTALFRKNAKLNRLNEAVSYQDKKDRWDGYFATPRAFETSLNDQDSKPKKSRSADVRGLQQRDFAGYLPYALLERADRMGMANGLEVRPSMLDPDLLKIANQISVSKLTGLFKSKDSYRRAASLILGKDIAFRRSKGFPIPLDLWIRDELRLEFESTLATAETELNSFVPLETRIDIFNEHLSGKRNHALLIFTWVSFIIWEKQWN